MASRASLMNERPQVPAWLASAVVHALLILLVALWVARTPQGAAEAPLRDAGIVLKTVTSAGEKFAGEEANSNTPTSSNQSNSPTNAVEALPNATTNSRATDVLPELPDGMTAADAASSLPSAGGLAASGAGMQGSRVGAGGEATVSVFGVEGTGTKFVYLFDRSPSMEGAPLAAAKKQLTDSLDSLEATHQFQIIFFSTEPSVFDITGQNRIAFANEQNKNKARQLVAGVSTFGGTDRRAALMAALGFAPDVIFFLTDADDAMPVAELEEVLKRNRRIGASINTIEFGRGAATGRSNFLKQLSGATGGNYGYVDTTRLRRN